MKRRTFQRVQAEKQPQHHHNVYVVLIDPAVGRIHYEDVVYDNQKP
jgi:hypothetical protein